ncbi:hypothetical protein RND81_10G213700 [Saponaria officinalis]|uniref:Uncharacterized protein n=1 Tax=Saponaria officinalis TaxID=3572 RepID=A0AAW1I680_SAPOF
MDLWVVAAAAGAGYLAKHWQNIFRDKDDSSEFNFGKSFLDELQSPSLIERIRDKTSPLTKLSRTRVDTEKGVETSMRDGPVGREAICSSVGRDDDGSVASEYMFSQEFGNVRKFDQYRSGYEFNADMSDIPENSAWDARTSRRNKKFVRSRRLHLQFVKPRNSLDSCLMAQMEREHVELDEYLLTPLSSPCTPSLRPFLVSDGKRLISKVKGEFSNGLFGEVHPRANKDVVGVPRLPKVNPAYYSKQKFISKNHMGKSHFSRNSMQFDSKAGFLSGKALFCLGISIGILSTIIANKAELEKLKESLKQSENLVEDLQDELEMKDSLTVKELVHDDDSQDIHGISSVTEVFDVFSDQADVNVSIRNADEESVSLTNDHSITNIEAELEAELERLELTMKGSTRPGELNHEFDEGMIAELVCGELNSETVRRRSSSEHTLDRGSSPHSTKDGVSPRDLSLRLHEVIQSRLEERITELETELAKSRNNIHHLVSEKNTYWSASAILSSVSKNDPLVMNLSGDAVDAYNEAFEELNMLKPSKDETSQITIDHVKNDTSSSRQSAEDGLTEKREEAVRISITGIPSSEDSPIDNFYNSDDNNDDDDDMLLIKQIVEKARQGSPAILRAQKAMVSLNRYQ